MTKAQKYISVTLAVYDKGKQYKTNIVKREMKVLIVDDEKNIVDLIQKNLKLEGYETIGAYSGQEAIKKVKTENDELLKLVTFQLGEELYGVEIMDVDQIVRVQEVRPIPNAPYYVEGIFNLRSEIIPIISLHKRFHIKKASIDENDQFLGGFIIIKIENNKLGIIIDKIARVVDVKKEDIQPPPQMIAGIGAEYIHGVVRRDSGYLIILDIHRLSNPKELQKITTNL